jgi:hypothetical protein
MTFVKEQALKAEEGEWLLGSSEIIESAFGKLKSLEHEQAKGGFTGMLLSLSACVGTISREMIEEALQAIPTQKLLDWIKENIPVSVQSNRKKFQKRSKMRNKNGRSLWPRVMVDFYQPRSMGINRTYARGKIGPPKNGKRRTVDMSRQLTAVLQEHRLQQKHRALKRGWGFVPEWVFVNSVGKPLDINHWRKRVFYRVLKKAGIKKIRVHDLRHTYASLLIQGGESLAYVRDQLGHHSIKVTVDIYGHLVPGVNKAAVDRLDDPITAAPICTLSAPNEKGANRDFG